MSVELKTSRINIVKKIYKKCLEVTSSAVRRFIAVKF